MKLLELYSLSSGLKIGKQWLLEHFWPLQFERYITLHASSGMGGKNYPFWSEVIGIIKPYLTAHKIEIIQLGVKDDPSIPGCHHLMGKYNVGQGSHILRKSLCHAANDSLWCHRAGHLGIPIVEVFGPTTEENHGPLEFDPLRSVFISSHRWGRAPSFAAQENPMSIALIDAFDISRAILNVLNIPHAITAKTQCIGPMFGAPLLEIIPNVPVSPAFNPDVTSVVRLDLEHNEEVLAQILQGRKVNLVTKKPVNLQLLAALKGNVLTYSHEVDKDCSPDYLKQVAKIIPKSTFFSRTKDEAELAALRFQFFDVARLEQVVDKTRADFETAVREYLNDKSFSLDSEGKVTRLMFKAQKYVLSKGKIYLSLAHERADKPMDGSSTVAPVIDSPDLWRDFLHYLFYVG